MDFNEFLKIEETKESIIAKLEYLKNIGLKEYIDYATNMMGLKRLPKKNKDRIIEQIISKSPNDLSNKTMQPEYYKAHFVCLQNVLNEMLLHEGFIDNIKQYTPETSSRDIVIYNYHKLISELLHDMILILQDYSIKFNNKELDHIRLGKNRFQSDFTLYQLLPQIIFGQVSYHSYIEKEPFVSIGIIRQITEIKIRRSFGILGIYDKTKDSFEPLGMNKIIEELKKYETEIEFTIPLDNIARINGWSNIYLHSGLKDYLWTTIFVYQYIHELIKGKQGSYNLKSGIKLKKETLDKIHNGIENWLHENNTDYELIKCSPEALIEE